jgi:hypothetical protein
MKFRVIGTLSSPSTYLGRRPSPLLSPDVLAAVDDLNLLTPESCEGIQISQKNKMPARNVFCLCR